MQRQSAFTGAVLQLISLSLALGVTDRSAACTRYRLHRGENIRTGPVWERQMTPAAISSLLISPLEIES